MLSSENQPDNNLPEEKIDNKQGSSNTDISIPDQPQSKSFSNQVNKSRLIVIESIYFQQSGQQPTCIESRFLHWIESDEQPYQRQIKVGTEWKQLDRGWIEGKSSLLIISHDAKQYLQNPTEEEKILDNSRRLQIGILPSSSKDDKKRTMFNQPKITYNPIVISSFTSGRSFRLEPEDLELIYLRCTEGMCKATITIFPS